MKFNWFAIIRLGLFSYLIGCICNYAEVPFWVALVLVFGIGFSYPEPMYLPVKEAKNDK